MKEKGVVRYIDKLGRLVIPIELRREAGLFQGEPTEIIPKDGYLIVKKYEEACIICGKSQKEHMIIINDKKVCDSCSEKIKKYN